MTANDSKSYLGCLNKLVDENNNTYHCPTGKKFIHSDYSALLRNLNRVIKLLSLKLVIESGLLSIKIFWAKVMLKSGPKKNLWFILWWKLIFGCVKLKIYPKKK